MCRGETDPSDLTPRCGGGRAGCVPGCDGAQKPPNGGSNNCVSVEWFHRITHLTSGGGTIEENAVLSFENPKQNYSKTKSRVIPKHNYPPTGSRKSLSLKQKGDKKIHLVSPEWLWSCWYHWEKAEEVLISSEKETARFITFIFD